MARVTETAEGRRLLEAREGVRWRRYGTYLSERQWGTVREDYSPNGDAWRYLPHDHARSRAYRWGDDGLLGLCDNRGLLNFAVSLWNGKDPILKERLYGLSGKEGNHGEDVKEEYFYLDATPTHSYCRALYKYPQRAFPYAELGAMSDAAGVLRPEPELGDTGIFDDDRYFDVFVEYAKATKDDVLVRVTIVNRGPEEASLELLPTLWFRNTWSWTPTASRPSLVRDASCEGEVALARHEHLGDLWFSSDASGELVFTENETNDARLFGSANASPYVKDAFHELVVDGKASAVNPAKVGTKCAFRHRLRVGAGESRVVRLRISNERPSGSWDDFDAIVGKRLAEADEFFAAVMPKELEPDARLVYRQAVAGLLWTKQFYHLDVDRWLRGDVLGPPPPESRKSGRNSEWTHLYNSEVLSIPDKWEYPWYAAWDLAFHCIPIALVDPEFAKQQLSLLTREWYMHPNGQLPAYEWAFGDVNPPVHAWAALRVYQIERRMTGRADRAFLETVFHKLMLNFTWWVNRKDASGKNVFQGGFLGLDNIGVFDRSSALPEGGQLEQADATSWMGMYCLNLLTIALELSRENPTYQDVANKFFEHFLLIAHAMNEVSGDGMGLWDDEDGFFYDVLHFPGGASIPMRLRSMVGLIPLFAVDTLEPEVFAKFPTFAKRMSWFLENRPELSRRIANLEVPGRGKRRLLSLLDEDRFRRVLRRLLDENEFLSPHGIRALSKAHAAKPYEVELGGVRHRVAYEPGESQGYLFGGNSNWRGPVWFPVNYLIIESLQKYHHYFGDSFKVECPTGSGIHLNLWDVASELSRRLVTLFLKDDKGERPARGAGDRFQTKPDFADCIPFHEYFHGDTGKGLGASHQTGWTALVAKLLDQSPQWKVGLTDSQHGGGY
ncbi:MAG: glucosidase [Polyangiaceae bacterium]